MASRTVGPAGARLAGLAYVGLHYALLVAYIAQGGEILQGGLQALVHSDIPRVAAPVLFTAVLGGALAFGNKHWLDKANDALVSGREAPHARGMAERTGGDNRIHKG
jgi:tyrosine-specific transport protein